MPILILGPLQFPVRGSRLFMFSENLVKALCRKLLKETDPKKSKETAEDLRAILDANVRRFARKNGFPCDAAIRCRSCVFVRKLRLILKVVALLQYASVFESHSLRHGFNSLRLTTQRQAQRYSSALAAALHRVQAGCRA
jgi:hypothetical protein